MATFFLSLLVLGSVVLALQLVLGVIGAEGHALFDADHDVHAADGLDLFTVRALSAAAAAFGLTGLVVMRAGLPGWLAAIVGLVAAIAAAWGVASTMRTLKGLEQDRSFRIEQAVGLPATVSLGIPGQRTGEGKVHLIAHERFQEFNALTNEDAIPSGTDVLVTDTVSSDTVIVSRRSTILEESDDVR